MSSSRDELWVDMTQFDTRTADGVWEGEPTDPDAPAWYGHMRTLIHRARGPAEAHELVDEPVLVETMRRATLGATLADLQRGPGVRALGRVLATKAAAAATTASLASVAAAAATTGVVATVTATMVVPAINEHVMPIIENGLTPAVVAPHRAEHEGGAGPTTCDPEDGGCRARPGDLVVVDVPAPEPRPATAPMPAPATAVPVTATATATESVTATPVSDTAPAEPAPVAAQTVAPEPVATQTVAPEPVAAETSAAEAHRPEITAPAPGPPSEPAPWVSADSTAEPVPAPAGRPPEQVEPPDRATVGPGSVEPVPPRPERLVRDHPAPVRPAAPRLAVRPTTRDRPAGSASAPPR
jgi:hypothetical protein